MCFEEKPVTTRELWLRVMHLMKEGGFVPLPDHLIVPGTSLEDYKYYLKRIGELRF